MESMILENSILIRFKKNQFLFEELVKRDFKQKYKRTILGMAWSLISPLLTLLVLKLVFSHYFGRSIPHYVIYLMLQFPFDFFDGIKSNCHAPLHYFYLKLWMMVFRNSDFMLRMSSLIKNSLSIVS